MSIPVAQPMPALVDADGRVCVDAVCLGCGYNLRTLPEDAVCPECAQPVRRSLVGEQLTFAAPHWVRRLARGATLMLITVASLLGMALLFPVVGLFGAMAGGSGPPVGMLVMIGIGW